MKTISWVVFAHLAIIILIVVTPFYGSFLFRDRVIALAMGAAAGLFLLLIQPFCRSLYRNWFSRGWIGRQNIGAWIVLAGCAFVLFGIAQLLLFHWTYDAYFRFHHSIDFVYVLGLMLSGALFFLIAFTRQIELAKPRRPSTPR